MAHLQISRKDGGGYAVIIDGVDIGDHVMHDGFSIEPADAQRFDCALLGWEVRLRIFAHTLDADLPDAVIIAERQGDDQ